MSIRALLCIVLFLLSERATFGAVEDPRLTYWKKRVSELPSIDPLAADNHQRRKDCGRQILYDAIKNADQLDLEDWRNVFSNSKYEEWFIESFEPENSNSNSYSFMIEYIFAFAKYFPYQEKNGEWNFRGMTRSRLEKGLQRLIAQASVFRFYYDKQPVALLRDENILSTYDSDPLQSMLKIIMAIGIIAYDADYWRRIGLWGDLTRSGYFSLMGFDMAFAEDELPAPGVAWKNFLEAQRIHLPTEFRKKFRAEKLEEWKDRWLEKAKEGFTLDISLGETSRQKDGSWNVALNIGFGKELKKHINVNDPFMPSSGLDINGFSIQRAGSFILNLPADAESENVPSDDFIIIGVERLLESDVFFQFIRNQMSERQLLKFPPNLEALIAPVDSPLSLEKKMTTKISKMTEDEVIAKGKVIRSGLSNLFLILAGNEKIANVINQAIEELDKSVTPKKDSWWRYFYPFFVPKNPPAKRLAAFEKVTTELRQKLQSFQFPDLIIDKILKGEAVYHSDLDELLSPSSVSTPLQSIASSCGPRLASFAFVQSPTVQ